MAVSITNKWALVTGASRGIGQQIAIGLAMQGCNLVLHARQEQHLAETETLLKRYDIKSYKVSGDLLLPECRQQLIAQILQAPAPIDILYNNAAINCMSTPVFEFSLQTWLDVFQVNVLAIVELCNALCPGMKERGWGRVVNMSSGIENQPNLAPYSVSKAAIDKLTKDLAFEFEGTNVRVNYLDPGWIQTDLGGPDAWEPVESVLPGVLAPVLLSDDGINGGAFAAQDYKGDSIQKMLEKMR